MATKQEIVADIRTVYPKAGTLCKAEALRYIRKSKTHPCALLESIEPVNVDGKPKYLVIDIADKLYRSQGGA